MKSKGLFPSSGRSGPRRTFGGSAGNSSSNNKPASGNGYRAGMLGWRAGHTAGGETMQQQSGNRPQPTDKSISGRGGFAYDRSMSPYIGDEKG